MATLNSSQLTKLRQIVAKGESEVLWDKATINAALQAAENSIGPAFTVFKNTVSDVIDTSTAPLILPPSIKVKLVRRYLRDLERAN